MKQKAISPFIAVILTIAATVVISGLIAGWGTTLFKSTAGTVEQKASNFTIQCAVGMLDIEKIYCTSDSNGLVGYWKLDSVNTSNYTLDVSGYNNHGRLYNYPCNPATCNLTDGKYGNALQFDGVNDYVNCGHDASLNLVQELTYEIWAKYTGSDDATAVLMDRQNFLPQLAADAINQGIIWRAIGENVGTWLFHLSATLTRNVWHHVVGTFSYSQGVARIYVDGQLVSEATGITDTIDSVPTADLFVGNMPPYYDPKVVDEVRIYNRALSAGEIKRHYEHGVAVRALVSNIGQTNLGTQFTLGWTVNNSFNSSLVNLTSDLTPGSVQWLNKYNITEAGNLENVRIISYLCPNVARSKDVTGMIC